MRKFNSEETKSVDITLGGVDYSFLVDKQGIGVRRLDAKTPTITEVRKITHYVFAEGWADREDYEEDEQKEDWIN